MSWLSTRMSTYQMNYFLRDNVSQSSLQLQRAGQELSTGRRSDMFGDLGPRAGIAITMRGREENTQSYITANKALENKLEAMLTAVTAIRDPAQDVLQAVLLNKEAPVTGAHAMQAQARAALETVISTLNTSFNGEHLFAGTVSNVPPMTRWSEAHPDTGLSPEAIMQAVIGTGPADATEAATIIAELDAVFSSSHGTTPDYDFEASFYSGTPELDGGGQPSERITARLDVGQVLNYGVQANDQGLRDVIKGLAMIATIDPQDITDPDAYRAWMEEATQVLSSGVQGTLDAATNIGFNQQLVDKAQQRLEDMSLVQRTQIGTYENIDPYEVATKMTALETQLQASYNVSARLSGLSILSHMR
ncbi:flagellin [Cognatishimia sp. SS12]|uniref:flagellin N-terminal helical domain-containing protein n=1 Tax=Cognatishimia sp. SS12 TaxID=2979465 RepID=UPI00232F3556|nr:flagellin [Cognatishimia sp. SS12]MDC0739465.1 flagellin [Cognatishimia sp. SS12]